MLPEDLVLLEVVVRDVPEVLEGGLGLGIGVEQVDEGQHPNAVDLALEVLP